MQKRLFILFAIIFLISLLSFFWWEQAQKPTDPTNNKTTIFKITKGENARGIAERLQKEGLIRSSVAFFLLARFGGLGDNIQAGEFQINPAMNLKQVAEILKHGTLDVQIMIPEGWRKEEIAFKLTKELSIPETEFIKLAREGYMFPDTYLIYKEATAQDVITIFQNNFNKKVSKDLVDKAQKKGLTLDEVIIIASLVEREAKFPEDRPLVASVILNRNKIGMKLDLDASIQYILGYQTKEKSWWKRDLTREDLEINSPYNTYLHAGLPPTAISNPGLAAIVGVVSAPESDYMYYISDKTGKIHFAKTLEEHNLNIAKYL